MKLDQISVQMYTLRDLTASDMLGTLRNVAAVGYRAVELAGYGNATPQTIRATLEELNLLVPSAHVSLQQLESDPLAAINDMQTLSCSYVVVPFVGEDQRGSVDQVRRLAERLNTIGRQVAENGMRLGYHNHAFEFAPLEGTTMWDVLADATDPALVDLELDVYWAIEGGRDPLDLIGQYGSRLKLLHLKDRADGDDAPVGEGTVDWTPILQAAEQAGTQLFVVEQDHPRDPLNNVASSFRYLQARAEQ